MTEKRLQHKKVYHPGLLVAGSYKIFRTRWVLCPLKGGTSKKVQMSFARILNMGFILAGSRPQNPMLQKRSTQQLT